MPSRRAEVDVILDRLNTSNWGQGWAVRITVHGAQGEGWEFKRLNGVWSVDVDMPPITTP